MKLYLLLILTVVFSLPAFGQTKATTDDGKKVILNENGTWHYAPTADKNTPAVLYIYRLKEPGIYNRSTPISLDGKEVLEIKQGDFVGIQLPAGKHIIRTNKDDSTTNIEMESGGHYFTLLTVAPGGFSQSHIFTETPEAQAVLQLKKTEIIDSKQIKVKDLVLVKEKP